MGDTAEFHSEFQKLFKEVTPVNSNEPVVLINDSILDNLDDHIRRLIEILRRDDNNYVEFIEVEGFSFFMSEVTMNYEHDFKLQLELLLLMIERVENDDLISIFSSLLMNRPYYIRSYYRCIRSHCSSSSYSELLEPLNMGRRFFLFEYMFEHLCRVNLSDYEQDFEQFFIDFIYAGLRPSLAPFKIRNSNDMIVAEKIEKELMRHGWWRRGGIARRTKEKETYDFELERAAVEEFLEVSSSVIPLEIVRIAADFLCVVYRSKDKRTRTEYENESNY